LNEGCLAAPAHGRFWHGTRLQLHRTRKGGVAALKSDAVIGSIEILHCAELAFIAYAALRSQTFPHWTRGPN
jgi:hypothetical protein